MIQNKYFIISLPEPALNAILEHCIESSNTVRKNNDGTKAVVKLPVGADVPGILQSKTSYSHTEIISELSNSEWVSDDI